MEGSLKEYRYVHQGILTQVANLQKMALALREEALREGDLEGRVRPVRREARWVEAAIQNHSLGEEKVIIPALKEFLRKRLPPGISRLPGLARDIEEATSSLEQFVVADHREVEGLASQVAAGARQLRDVAPGEARASLIRTLQQQAVALHAILSLHFRKENDYLFPLAQARFSPEEQDNLMRQASQAAGLAADPAKRAETQRRFWRALGPEERGDWRATLIHLGLWAGDENVIPREASP